MARHVAKFHGATPPNLKVIGANTLNYKPIFDPLWKKCKGNLHPLWSVGCGQARLGHSVTRVKISGRSTPYGPKYGLPKKSISWVGLNISRENAVESGPKFTGLFSSNAGGNAGYLCPFLR